MGDFCACGCLRPVPESGPSPWFASERCQQLRHARSAIVNAIHDLAREIVTAAAAAARVIVDGLAQAFAHVAELWRDLRKVIGRGAANEARRGVDRGRQTRRGRWQIPSPPPPGRHHAAVLRVFQRRG